MSPWKRDTPARVTEHENKRIGRVLQDHLRKFTGKPQDVRAVTGKELITRDDDE